ncbi:MAG: hypothetical protein KAJ24_03140 [Candidatus Aenigmarchaeota archaeon]|nr:hypothetical protein [Candidatus Aenigmarchaeota archaeon]
MKPTKEDCQGCEDNFYNGNNPYGVKECMRFKDAKIVSMRAVPVSQAPPWNQPKTKVPDCYRRKGYYYTDKKGW